MFILILLLLIFPGTRTTDNLKKIAVIFARTYQPETHIAIRYFIFVDGIDRIVASMPYIGRTQFLHRTRVIDSR